MKMDPQTLQRFKNATKDDEVVFLFMPSANLKQKLAQGNDPILNQIPKQHIEALFLCGEAIGLPLKTKMVIDYLEGTLDERNEYMLSLGEIRVVGIADMKLPGSGIVS